MRYPINSGLDICLDGALVRIEPKYTDYNKPGCPTVYKTPVELETQLLIQILSNAAQLPLGNHLRYVENNGYMETLWRDWESAVRHNQVYRPMPESLERCGYSHFGRTVNDADVYVIKLEDGLIGQHITLMLVYDTSAVDCNIDPYESNSILELLTKQGR